MTGPVKKDSPSKPDKSQGDAKEKSALSDQVFARTADLENKLKRALADYQNLEKRTQKEKEEIIKFANQVFLLQVIGIIEGLELVTRQFEELLKREGFARVEVRSGDNFDPTKMEAIDGDGEVVDQVFSSAYQLHGKIVRPARVRVKREKDVK